MPICFVGFSLTVLQSPLVTFHYSNMAWEKSVLIQRSWLMDRRELNQFNRTTARRVIPANTINQSWVSEFANRARFLRMCSPHELAVEGINCSQSNTGDIAGLAEWSQKACFHPLPWKRITSKVYSIQKSHVSAGCLSQPSLCFMCPMIGVQSFAGGEFLLFAPFLPPE